MRGGAGAGVAHDLRTPLSVLILATAAIAPDRPLPGAVVALMCDSLPLEQLTTNLLSNAVKYIRRLILPSRSPWNRARITPVLRVTDHGVGLSADELPYVFEPFRRVGLSKDAVPGVGLGLFVVKRIAEAHGGRIEIDSTPGMGSTFLVFLPTPRRLPSAARAQSEPRELLSR